MAKSSSLPNLPAGWNTTRIPDLSGKRYLVTGGNSGLGLETAKALASKGAHVTVTARSAIKGAVAMAETGAQEFIEMDLGSLASIREAATQVTEPYNVVFLNAGIMAVPFSKTVDGFESQLGVNHLGHFAFAGLIERFVTDRWVDTTSFAHRLGGFGSKTVEEVRNRCLGVGKYSPWIAYGDSKLAGLLFMAELERRRIARGYGAIPMAAHPGWSDTNLFKHPVKATAVAKLSDLVAGKMAQTGAQGALPMLCAALLEGVNQTAFVGPNGFMELKGSPKFTHAKALAYDQSLATALWQVSEELTGVTWENAPHA